jgi:acyl carrier protein
LDALKEFTLLEAGRDTSGITESTCLERDLGIYGDDAVDYIVAFGKAFNVDVSKFMAADYFTGEGFSLLEMFKKGREKKELSIGALIKAIKAGRLDEEVINS